MAAPSHPCPVCTNPLENRQPVERGVFFVCPRCGIFGLSAHTEDIALPDLLTSPRKRSVLSYAISKTPHTGPNTHLFTLEECKRILAADILPTPQQQGEHLVRWLGNNLSGSGDVITLTFSKHGPLIEALSEDAFDFVLEGLATAGLVHAVSSSSLNDVGQRITLTFNGWSLFEQLRRAPSGRRAFIAMQYNDIALDAIVNDHFRPAVAETGFVLRRLDDEQPAGLIDDRMRLEIQSAHFLIVDLSHHNRGAYWEGGYAEGLGKPVIYTCEEAAFHKTPSHFDTNHHLHILWKADDIAPAVAKLKATIRATIPEATRG